MSEEQLKAAEAEAMAQEESAVEEISEEDLEDLAGGSSPKLMKDNEKWIMGDELRE